MLRFGIGGIVRPRTVARAREYGDDGAEASSSKSSPAGGIDGPIEGPTDTSVDAVPGACSDIDRSVALSRLASLTFFSGVGTGLGRFPSAVLLELPREDFRQGQLLVLRLILASLADCV